MGAGELFRKVYILRVIFSVAALRQLMRCVYANYLTCEVEQDSGIRF